jgi:sugar O-acyltransferase (sialic acid O-acetyltransferase NeuD family)
LTASKVIVIGAGGHALVVIDALIHPDGRQSDLTVTGIFDDDPSLKGESVGGVPVLGSISDARAFPHDAVIIAIGNNLRRQEVFRTFRKAGSDLVNAVHPSAVIAGDVQTGKGVAILAGAVVNPASVIGDNVILNTGCSIDHHNKIGDHSHVAPGARLGGSCSIGEGVLVGIGATVLPGTSIGEGAVVGAGAVVIRDVDPGTTVVGNPATTLD